MTCGKCDVKYKSPEVSRLEQELAELKKLAGELIEQWNYSKDVGIDDYIEQLKQAVTLANKDSKEEDK